MGQAKQYGDFGQMLKIRNRIGSFNTIQSDMQADAVARAEMVRTLGDMGFRHFNYVGTGNFSLVLNTTDNQVVRVYKKTSGTKDRPVHPAILQAIATREFNVGEKEYVIEVLPKIRNTRAGFQDCEKVNAALLKSGIRVSDYNAPGNIGYIRVRGENVPVLLDPGMAEYLPEYNQKKDATEHLQPWLAADGSWLQHMVEERSKPSGVITGDELKNVERVTGKRRGRVGQTATAIAKDGFYQPEVEAMYARAMYKLDRNPTENFSDLLKAEREGIKKERDAGR